MLLRDAVADDIADLTDVFFRAVREGALGPYSETECAAWAPCRPTPEYWAKRIEGLDTIVADQDGKIVGFMAWNKGDGDLDLAFVLPEMRGKGVTNAIYAMVENRARSQGAPRLHAHASHLAKPFFMRQGWDVLRENQVDLEGICLTNWVMEKSLSR